MNNANPWSKVGWIEAEEPVKVSPCCGLRVCMSRGDGVTMGTCEKCDSVVVRLNATTGKQEVPDTPFWL